jgi:SWIM zinc finger
VTRPRQAFGSQPGRLPATLLRALSAELSDPGRYRRAKEYARDGAVIEIDVRPGVVAGQVLGSRRSPYEVAILADPVDDDELAVTTNVVTLVPERTELAVSCTCPDADGGMMCKHALALLMVLADEVSIEPELLARWRRAGPESPGRTSRLRGRRTTSAPSPGGRGTRPSGAGPAPPRVDVLAPLLRSPSPLGPLPEIPAIESAALLTPPARADATSELLDRVLADAVDRARLAR